MRSSVDEAQIVVRAMAEAAVENERYFGDLDAVVGDGDFGFSLARGFEVVLARWDELDRSSVGAFLKAVGMIITTKVGGTSGPLWGRHSCVRPQLLVRRRNSARDRRSRCSERRSKG